MKILIVEDDELQAEWVRKQLKKYLPRAEVELISTELEFRSKVDEIAAHPPDIVLMDIMLRWTDPGHEITQPPEDIKKAGFFHAGFRCQKLLSEQEPTRNIPILIYTVLEREDLESELVQVPPNVKYFGKDVDPKTLTDRIRYHLPK